MTDKQPNEDMCAQFKAKPGDFVFVPTGQGSVESDCKHCVFGPPEGGICSYKDSRCYSSDRTDGQAGYWVLTAKPTNLTLEEAEAKITELQQYVMELKTTALIAGEVYKHKPTGSLYLVVTDPDDGERRLLFCLKGDKGHADNVYFCKSFRAKADIEGKRSAFLRMCTIQDLL
jgi:hypothetical protein